MSMQHGKPKDQQPEEDFAEGMAELDEATPEDMEAALSEDEMDAALGGDTLSNRIAELEAEVTTLREDLLRQVAEVENIRKRSQRDREDASKYAISNFARALLPVADHLRRAIDAVTEDQRADSQFQNFLTGIEATERELLRACEAMGISPVTPGEEIFDPNLHEVMYEIDNTGKPAGTVIHVIEPGYRIHDRLLRPARVAVAKGDSAEAAQQTLDTEV